VLGWGDRAFFCTKKDFYQQEDSTVIIQASKRFVLLFFCLIALTLATAVFMPVVKAAGGQISLSGQTTGHVGAKFHLDAVGLTPDGTYNLYVTTDTTKCTVGDPGTLGLQAFTPSSITISGGAFSQDLTWPATISQEGIYFLCAVDSIALTGLKTASSNTFTVAPAPTLKVTPNSVIAGQSVTIAGTNWLPVQTLDVSIVTGDSGAPALIDNNNVQPDTLGSFSVALTVPENAPAGSYGIRAYGLNDQTLTLVKNDSLRITKKATPTPTPTEQPSPTSTPTIAVPTPTPTIAATNSGNTNPPQTGSDGNGPLNLLIFGIGALGILFVLIGVVIFAVSTQGENG
jgi:hypothetical protein